jgi:hypothetical protein
MSFMLRRICLLTVGFVITKSVFAADIPPLITIVQPQAGAASASELESVVMEVDDDEPLPDLAVQFLLNGAPPSKGSIALTPSDEGRRLRVELAFALTVNEDYVFEAIATDSEGLTNLARIYFDTFDPNRIVIEAEDYNYQSSRFIDSPNLTPEGMTNQLGFNAELRGIPRGDRPPSVGQCAQVNCRRSQPRWRHIEARIRGGGWPLLHSSILTALARPVMGNRRQRLPGRHESHRGNQCSDWRTSRPRLPPPDPIECPLGSRYDPIAG